MVTGNKNIINRKIILLEKGFTVTSIAKKLGCSRQGVNKYITGNIKRLDQCSMLDSISDALGVSKEGFWPEFYGPDKKRFGY
jgi:transcriptional regulator with XRE-family HTH domain